MRLTIPIGIVLTFAGATGIAYGWIAYGGRMAEGSPIPWGPIAGGGGAVAAGLALVIAGVMQKVRAAGAKRP